jgi:uncharacterized surface protein with fasciclin (FAS1) repeats
VDDREGTAEVSDETLASVVEDADGLSTVSGVLGDAGLEQVFDGAAAYTLFAPQDAAFDALGEAGEELRTAEQRAAMVAILRDHIVPGYLTPDDIANAIEMADDGSVEMRTMGDRTLTFTGERDAITVTAEDGASARFAGDALRASNGVAIPLDGLLRKVGETPQG